MDWLNKAEKAAQEVWRVLGEGWEEKVYEEALADELRLRKIPYERQRNFEILYRGYKVGECRADLILNPLWAGRGGSEVVLELKPVKSITEAHQRQVQVYMVSLNIEKGAVLSFGDGILMQEVKRQARNLDDTVAQPTKTCRQLGTILKSAAEMVYQYFGSEFI